MNTKYLDAIRDVYCLNKIGFKQALVSSVGIALAEVGAMYSIFTFLSLFFDSGESKFNESIKKLILIDPSEHKYLTAICFFLALIFFLIVKLWCVKILNVYIFNSESILSSRMVSSYLNSNYAILKNKNYSDINKLIFSDAAFIIKGILSPLINILVQIVIIISIMAVLIYQSFLLSISSLFLIILTYLIFATFSKSSITKSSTERHISNKKRFQYLETIFSLRRQIKLKSRESYFIERFAEATKKYAYSQIILNNVSAFPRMIGELVIGLLAITFVLITTIKGTNILSAIPTLGLFLIGAYKLIQPLQTIFSSFASMRHSWPAFLDFRSAGNFLDEKINYSEQKANIFIKAEAEGKEAQHWKKIQYNNINYSICTDERKFELKNINFELNIGEMVGIIGKSGAGKSTLIDIISGLITPNNFSCNINNLNTLCYKDYAEFLYLNVGYVPHDFEILPDNIYENISLGSTLSEKEIDNIKYYLSKMELDFLLKDFELEKPIYSNLLNCLSEGQKQRIALIRSIYNNPKMLILDEFTSAMDSHTEGIVLDILNDLKQERFILMVSHRQEPLKICNSIYLLDKNGIEKLNEFDIHK